MLRESPCAAFSRVAVECIVRLVRLGHRTSIVIQTTCMAGYTSGITGQRKLPRLSFQILRVNFACDSE